MLWSERYAFWIKIKIKKFELRVVVRMCPSHGASFPELDSVVMLDPIKNAIESGPIGQRGHITGTWVLHYVCMSGKNDLNKLFLAWL